MFSQTQKIPLSLINKQEKVQVSVTKLDFQSLFIIFIISRRLINLKVVVEEVDHSSTTT